MFFAVCALATGPLAAQTDTGLQQRYAQMQDALAHSPFGRPVQLASAEAGNTLQGDIFALVDQPFETVLAALQPARNWCEVLMLHLNTKGCTAEGAGDAATLQVAIGRKSDQPLADAQRVAFQFRVAAARADVLEVRLQADKGPLSTRDYRIVLEAVPVAAGRKTFMHLRYSYAYGTAARLAMQGYLATIGRDKVGFTLEARDTGAEPQPVQGVRGVVERNTMRYYLAIDAYLGSLSAPPAEQREKRLAAWFDATERYPRQLHEVDRARYLDMKRTELARGG